MAVDLVLHQVLHWVNSTVASGSCIKLNEMGIWKMNKVIRNGKVAVLYSPGYGAGWFSWNTSHPEILFDPAIVELVEAERWDELRSFVTLKYPDIYAGGLEDLQIEWIPVGTQFQVNEYDGNESIEKRDSVDWITA